jgi:hypothetical protein
MSSLYFSSTQGCMESFLRRLHSSRDLLGACLADSSFPDGAQKRIIQSVSLQFPCRALLHQWGKEDSPNCPLCNERESLGHIQSRCKILEKPRIAAHHIQLFGLSGDEGDEHKWVIPSAVSADSHKELTVRQICQNYSTRWFLRIGRYIGGQDLGILCTTCNPDPLPCRTSPGSNGSHQLSSRH